MRELPNGLALHWPMLVWTSWVDIRSVYTGAVFSLPNTCNHVWRGYTRWTPIISMNRTLIANRPLAAWIAVVHVAGTSWQQNSGLHCRTVTRRTPRVWVAYIGLLCWGIEYSSTWHNFWCAAQSAHQTVGQNYTCTVSRCNGKASWFRWGPRRAAPEMQRCSNLAFCHARLRTVAGGSWRRCCVLRRSVEYSGIWWRL